jgi:hypothetical protein
MMRSLFFVLALVFVTPAWSQQTVVATCGTASYTAGTSANETQNTNGQTCS